MRALITGITGFAGSHLAQHLLGQADTQVVGLASPRSDGAPLPPWAERVELLRANLTDPAAVVRALEAAHPDAIYHLAAQASVPRAWSDPAATLTNNIAAQANLLQALVTLKLDPYILIVGSADEYGRVTPKDLPVHEDAPLRPVNPYAVSKVAQDYLGLQYYLSHGLHIVRVRPFNHIGPGQRTGFVAPDFAQQIARIEAGQQEPVLRVGNLAAQRDFTDVRDIVRGYALALAKGQAGQVYNLGSSQAHAIQEILDRLLSQSSTPIRVEPDPARMRPSDVPLIVSDCRRIRRDTGWEPRIPLQTSLQDVLAEWRARSLVHSTSAGA